MTGITGCVKNLVSFFRLRRVLGDQQVVKKIGDKFNEHFQGKDLYANEFLSEYVWKLTPTHLV